MGGREEGGPEGAGLSSLTICSAHHETPGMQEVLSKCGAEILTDYYSTSKTTLRKDDHSLCFHKCAHNLYNNCTRLVPSASGSEGRTQP